MLDEQANTSSEISDETTNISAATTAEFPAVSKLQEDLVDREIEENADPATTAEIELEVEASADNAPISEKDEEDLDSLIFPGVAAGAKPAKKRRRMIIGIIIAVLIIIIGAIVAAAVVIMNSEPKEITAIKGEWSLTYYTLGDDQWSTYNSADTITFNEQGGLTFTLGSDKYTGTWEYTEADDSSYYYTFTFSEITWYGGISQLEDGNDYLIVMANDGSLGFAYKRAES